MRNVVLSIALAGLVTVAQGGAWPLQEEIDRIAVGGGGTLVVTAGVHRTGALFFKPGVNLHLGRGAVIEGGDDEAAPRRTPSTSTSAATSPSRTSS